MSTVKHNLPCLGVVLAGGQSSRMGTDKAKLAYPASIAGIAQTMAEFSRELLLNAGANDVVMSGDNIGGIADDFPQGGPLSGILTVIKHFQPQALLIVPVDMPYLKADALQQLKQTGELGQCATYFDQSRLPLYLPINAMITQLLESQFNQASFKQSGKGPSFKDVIKLARGKSLTCTNPQYLINTNTPQEWQQACAQLNAAVASPTGVIS